MRIVGGSHRGHRLAAPRDASIRPTTDRARESLFNILAHGLDMDLEGSRVLDLFAGTGAVGLEALSRGASFVLFVEQSAQGRALIRSNVDALQAQGRSKLYRRDATGLGDIQAMEPFDILFADPPYEKGLGERALDGAARGNWLRAGALAVLEERATVTPEVGHSYRLLERRAFGDTAMHFFVHEPD